MHFYALIIIFLRTLALYVNIYYYMLAIVNKIK